MAPTGTKRPASATAKVAKRRATDDSGVRCTQISSAVKSAGLPTKNVAEMLSVATRGTLGVYKADRHPQQEEFVKMIGETLALIEAAKKNNISEAEGLVSNADAEKESREKASSDAAEKYSALCTAKQEAEDALQAAADTVTKARVAVSEAKAAQKNAEAAALSLPDQKSALELCQRAMAERGSESLQIKAAVAAFRSLDFTSDVLKYLPDVLGKAPGADSGFEAVLIRHVGDELAEKVSQHAADSAAAETKTSSTTEAATAAQKALEDAQQAVEDATKKLNTATSEMKEAAKSKADAEKHAAGFEKDKAAAGKKLEAATSDLEEFNMKVMASYQSLLEYAPPPPEPEPVEAEAEAAPVEPAVEADAEQPARADASMSP